MFNSNNYWERANRGEFQQCLRRNAHCEPAPPGEPFCTHSQMVSYLDAEGNEVARVHQYRRPDGTLGGSGKPDPKKLIVNGVLYRHGYPIGAAD